MGVNKRKEDATETLQVVYEEVQKLRHSFDAVLSRTDELLTPLEEYAHDAARRSYCKTFYTHNGPEQAHGVFLCCEADRLVHVEYVLMSGRSVVVVHDPPEVKQYGRLPSKRGKRTQAEPHADGAAATAVVSTERESDEEEGKNGTE